MKQSILLNIEDDLFKYKLNVFIGKQNDYINLLNRYAPAEKLDGVYGEFRVLEEQHISFLYLSKITDLKTLNHEVIHLVLYVLKTKGIPVDFDNQELIAYYHEWWVDKIKQTYRKYVNSLDK